MPFWFENLAAYCLQIAFLVAAGALTVRIFRVQASGVLLIFWQVLLAICLLLPVLQPWKSSPSKPLLRKLSTQPAAPVPVEEKIEGAPSTLEGGPPIANLPTYEVLGVLLLGGAMGRLIWLSLGLFRLRRYSRQAHLLTDLPPPMTQLCARLGMLPRIYVTAVADPVTFGVLSPVILLPRAFLEMKPDFQKVILCHEVCHIRRKDWVFTVAEELIRSVFWFHPAVLWLIGQIRFSREQVVDREVVRLTGERDTYFEALVEVLRNQCGARPVPAASLLGRRHLTRRLQMICREVSMSTAKLSAFVLTALVVAFSTGVLATWAFPLEEPAPPPPPASAVGPAEPKVLAPLSSESAAVPVAIAPVTAGQPKKSAPARTQPAQVEPVPVQMETLEGEVRDPTGALIPKVRISVMDKKTQELLQSGTTDDVGHFEFQVPADREVHLRFEYPGFKPAIYDAEYLWVGHPVVLKLGQVMETVEAVIPPLEGEQAKPPKREPIIIGGNVQPPRRLHAVEPVHPPEARRVGVSGVVLIQATIDERGQVVDPKVIRGHPLLIEAALEAVREWRFTPALLNAEPWPVELTVTVRFPRAPQ